ncbi:MAG: hypothetical protein R3E53_17630 [Myxococcota bacterium]
MTETTGAITAMALEDHDPGGSKAYLLRAAGRGGDVEPAHRRRRDRRDLPEGEVGDLVPDGRT